MGGEQGVRPAITYLPGAAATAEPALQGPWQVLSEFSTFLLWGCSSLGLTGKAPQQWPLAASGEFLARSLFWALCRELCLFGLLSPSHKPCESS